MPEVDLGDRKMTHGDFRDHARITQSLKNVMRGQQGLKRLTDMQVEALEMIFHKVGRILAGDPNVHDHWDDIAGYAKITSERIPKDCKQ